MKKCRDDIKDKIVKHNFEVSLYVFMQIINYPSPPKNSFSLEFLSITRYLLICVQYLYSVKCDNWTHRTCSGAS